MQNKKTSVFFQKCTSSSTYYRSVKYRVNSKTITEPQSLQKIASKNRHNTTDQIFSSSGKITKFKRYRTINNQQQQKQMSYLQTWRTLLQTIQLKGVDCKLQSKTQFIRLPIIRQQQKSVFTILNPLPLPIQFIKDEIKKAKINLGQSWQQINKIKGQMATFRSNIEKQLDATSEQITGSINRIRQSIAMDRVREQEIKLRNKRQCKDLQKEHMDNSHTFQTNKQRINNLQQTIFENKPFQLEVIHQNQSPSTMHTYF